MGQRHRCRGVCRALTFGDVIKIPFPYTNRPVRQRRPGLVVASHALAGAPALLWVLMITSAAHRRWPGDHEIADLPEAGLPAPSLVRCVKIATIKAGDAELIGSLSQSDKRQVTTHLQPFLAGVIA